MGGRRTSPRTSSSRRCRGASGRGDQESRSRSSRGSTRSPRTRASTSSGAVKPLPRGSARLSTRTPPGSGLGPVPVGGPDARRPPSRASSTWMTCGARSAACRTPTTGFLVLREFEGLSSTTRSVERARHEPGQMVESGLVPRPPEADRGVSRTWPAGAAASRFSSAIGGGDRSPPPVLSGLRDRRLLRPPPLPLPAPLSPCRPPGRGRPGAGPGSRSTRLKIAALLPFSAWRRRLRWLGRPGVGAGSGPGYPPLASPPVFTGCGGSECAGAAPEEGRAARPAGALVPPGGRGPRGRAGDRRRRVGRLFSATPSPLSVNAGHPGGGPSRTPRRPSVTPCKFRGRLCRRRSTVAQRGAAGSPRRRPVVIGGLTTGGPPLRAAAPRGASRGLESGATPSSRRFAVNRMDTPGHARALRHRRGQRPHRSGRSSPGWPRRRSRLSRPPSESWPARGGPWAS